MGALLTALALVGVGVAAGLCATVAGLASLVSYPALLAFGLSPVAANVTNTVALVATGIGAVTGSRPELAGQGRRLVRFGAAAAVGGAVGAAVLLTTPAPAFEAVVPYLVAGACVLVLVQPYLTARRTRRDRTAPARVAERSSRRPEDRPGALGAVAAVASYGGYFGAASGIATLAVLGTVLGESLPRVNALKNALSIAANAAAAIAFAFAGPVDWPVVAPLALGFFTGGRLGPRLVRRLPAGPLRVAIAIAGLALAARLAWTAHR